MMEHLFTQNIKSILQRHFGESAEDIYKVSTLLQYLNQKTRSANRGSKSRGSFANLYAIYVLVEDYIENGFHQNVGYLNYAGSVYSKLFKRQRELPFGAKLQNHALNNRLNSEFENWFPTSDIVPISRIADSDRYWINENLLKINVAGQEFNIALTIKDIIEDYINTKQDSFTRFIAACEQLITVDKENQEDVKQFVLSQLDYNVDARLFEIVSYAILKYFYFDQIIYWGYELNYDTLTKENLMLYKTGRTNANDGGIDFVMKPLGRFFQVTETLDFKKYFLDIDKLQKYPVSFVIKSDEDKSKLLDKIEKDALKSYSVATVVKKYLSCIEEIINIPDLKDRFNQTIEKGHLPSIMTEIVMQSKVEFNYNEVVLDEPTA